MGKGYALRSTLRLPRRLRRLAMTPAEHIIENGKLTIIVWALPTILINFRRKYHNFQLLIVNCQLER